jgi:hypothetical protein
MAGKDVLLVRISASLAAEEIGRYETYVGDNKTIPNFSFQYMRIQGVSQLESASFCQKKGFCIEEVEDDNVGFYTLAPAVPLREKKCQLLLFHKTSPTQRNILYCEGFQTVTASTGVAHAWFGFYAQTLLSLWDNVCSQILLQAVAPNDICLGYMLKQLKDAGLVKLSCGQLSFVDSGEECLVDQIAVLPSLIPSQPLNISLA